MRHRPPGGGEASIAIGAEQGQRAESSLDIAAQPVVDEDAIKAARIEARDLLGGDGVGDWLRSVGQRADNQNPAVRGAAKAVIVQGPQHRNAPCVAEFSERNDRLFLGRETIGAEP